ncbi:MAG: hypothetical protein RIS44_893 [Pseudomonadota bacterium]|jgi:hypothetical protein
MTWFDVLVEGASDVPAVNEVLQRKFGLKPNEHFRIHWHEGKGTLPKNPLSTPHPSRRQLLDQLPAKLRAYAKIHAHNPSAVIVVVVDADKRPCIELLADLNEMLAKLPVRPARVLFRIAIEETESWFISDTPAVLKAFPKAKISALKKIEPDAIVDAWRQLAKAIGSTGSSGTDKRRWAEKICPHLNLDNPASPSLQKLISGIARELQANKP